MDLSHVLYHQCCDVVTITPTRATCSESVPSSEQQGTKEMGDRASVMTATMFCRPTEFENLTVLLYSHKDDSFFIDTLSNAIVKKCGDKKLSPY